MVNFDWGRILISYSNLENVISNYVATKLENVEAQTWDGQSVKPRNIAAQHFHYCKIFIFQHCHKCLTWDIIPFNQFELRQRNHFLTKFSDLSNVNLSDFSRYFLRFVIVQLFYKTICEITKHHTSQV